MFASLLSHGGYYAPGMALVGGACLAGAAAVLLLGARPERPAALTAAALAALALWSAASVLWGGVPIVAWRFCALAVTGAAALLLASSLPRRYRAWALEGALAGLAVHAAVTLAVVGTGSFPDDWFSVRQLEGSVGYHNAIAAAYAMGIPLALWLAPSSDRLRRAASGAAAPLLLGGLLLTQARAAMAATVLVVVLQSVLTRRLRVATTGAYLAVIGVVLVVLLRQVDRALLDAGDAGPETGPLARYGVAVAICAAVGAVLALARPRTEPLPPRVRTTAIVAGGAVLAVLVVGAAAFAATHTDTIADRFSANPSFSGQVTGGQTRLSSLSPTGRIEQWRVSLEMTGEKPFLGHGAGAFATRWGIERSNKDLHVLQPHSIELETLAEMGVVGLVLFVAFVAGLGWILVGGLRQDRDVAAMGIAVVVAFLALASVDWVFSFGLLIALALLAAGTASAPPRRAPWPAATCIAATLVASVILFAPAMGTWYLERAQAAESHSIEDAQKLSNRARRFSPWDPAIVSYQGRIAEGLRQYGRAASLYDRAADLSQQPWTDRYRNARALLRAGRIAESRAACREAILANPLEQELREGICVGAVAD